MKPLLIAAAIPVGVYVTLCLSMIIGREVCGLVQERRARRFN